MSAVPLVPLVEAFLAVLRCQCSSHHSRNSLSFENRPLYGQIHHNECTSGEFCPICLAGIRNFLINI